MSSRKLRHSLAMYATHGYMCGKLHDHKDKPVVAFDPRCIELDAPLRIRSCLLVQPQRQVRCRAVPQQRGVLRRAGNGLVIPPDCFCSVASMPSASHCYLTAVFERRSFRP